MRRSERSNDGAAGARGRSAQVVPQPRERALIQLLAEEHAVPLDQLVEFLGCSRDEALATVATVEASGLIARRTFLAGDVEWYWLTHKGAALSGTGCGAFAPNVSSLRHRRAINAVRLYLAERAPNGTWISSGRLIAELGREEIVPDGVLEIDGERHAIEVELSRRRVAELRRILTAHSARWDVVVYFCARRTWGLLTRMRREGRWPGLIVRGLPPGSLSASGAARNQIGASRSTRTWRNDRAHRLPRSVTSRERTLLRLVAEQYAIPLDQLARFRSCDEREVESVAERLARAGLAEHGHLLASEPPWLWLTHEGARQSRAGYRRYEPRAGALARIRAVNEVRLHVLARAPQARWVSSRSLVRDHGVGGHHPNAVLEIGSERHAIEIERVSKGQARAARILDAHSARYDAVVLFCTPRMRQFFERLNANRRWPRVVIRDLPRSN